MQKTHHQGRENHQPEEQDQYGRNDPQSRELDLDVEQIRRRLLRLIIASVAVTLLLVGVVFITVVYKISRPDGPDMAMPAMRDSKKLQDMKTLKSLDREIAFSTGTRLLSQSISGSLISLEALKPDGNTELLIYNYKEGQIIARLQIPVHDISGPGAKKNTGTDCLVAGRNSCP